MSEQNSSQNVPAPKESQEIVSSTQDQIGVNLTIYNEDLALVKDKRRITLPMGQHTLAFREVSARMRPATAFLSGGPSILEQNFEYDLLSPRALLRKYVGREVQIVRRNPSTGTDLEPRRAKVLAVADGEVFLVDGHIETELRESDAIIYPDVPANLRDRPTLTMRVENTQEGPQEMELSYLSKGLSWQADYVAELAADGQHLDLKGWVTLDNQSGASYHNAGLQLVAGRVHVTEDEVEDDGIYPLYAMAACEDPHQEMEEESIFEYHLYTLGRPTTILDNQQKQVALLQARGVSVRKELVFRGRLRDDYRGRLRVPGDDLEVNVELELKNEQAQGLGMPIPTGKVRAYMRDSRGFLQFVGEDKINHIPNKGTMRLKLGSAFDVTVDKKETDYKELGDPKEDYNPFACSYEIVLHNGKNEAVQVKVLEEIPGDWQILQESAPHTKEDSRHASWLLEVPALGQSTLRYTVRIQR